MPENKDFEDKEPLSVVPVIISKDEMNLAEFPFTLLSRRANAGQKTIEVNQQVRDKGGKIIEQKWIVVSGSDKYGLPLAIDEDVYVALMQLYKDNNFKDRCVYFTRYQLVRMMGRERSKREYDRIEEALKRLISVTVYSKNAFWDNKAKRYINSSKGFHLFESYYLHDEDPGRKSPDYQPLSNIVMSPFLFDSIVAGYIKNLDTMFYFSLETPLSKRLYRYLDKKRYHKSMFEVELLKLAALLPIQDEYPSQIKRRLDSSHAELIERGFLESASYEKASSSDEEKVIYLFPQDSLAKQVEAYIPTDSDSQPEGSEEISSIKQKLIGRGVAENVASVLFENYPAQQIEKQIDVFDWLTEKGSSLLGKNPPGFLRKAIEDNYVPPPEYAKEAVQRERREAKNAREAEAEKRRQAVIEDELANWDRIPPEERVKGFVDFWIQGEKINKGHTPTPEEVEAKTRGQIDTLPQTEEERRQYLERKHALGKYL